MNPERAGVERVAGWLRRVGLDSLAAFLFEAAGPLTILGAQAAYLVEPFMGEAGAPIQDLAQILEDPDQVTELVERLRQMEKGT
jgi:predicted membrane protein